MGNEEIQCFFLQISLMGEIEQTAYGKWMECMLFDMLTLMKKIFETLKVLTA